MVLRSVLAAIALSCLGWANGAAAQNDGLDTVGEVRPAAVPTPADDGLAGDWLGLKPRLAEAGIDLVSHYVSEAAWNPTGGVRSTATEAGEFNVGARFDMNRIAGTDGTFQATLTYRRGFQLDDRAGLGTLQEVQEIFGRGHAVRLTQFWYEQRIGEGAAALKVGRTAPSEDFAAFSCTFQNLSFCGSQPGNLVGDYWLNWPISQWGARLRVISGALTLQAAVYEENPRNLDKKFAIGRFHGATGVLLPLEIGVTTGGPGGGPVGSYKIGGWISTAKASDVFKDSGGNPFVLSGLPPLQHGASYGIWANAEQQLTGISKDGKAVTGLSVFFNLTFADKRTSLTDNQIAAGLFARHAVFADLDDEVGIGLVCTHINAKAARGDRLVGKRERGSEYAMELYYGFRPVHWLQVRPNLQWIHQAGGQPAASEIAVLGLKSVLDF